MKRSPERTEPALAWQQLGTGLFLSLALPLPQTQHLRPNCGQDPFPANDKQIKRACMSSLLQ